MKRDGVISTLGVYKPKRSIKYSQLVSMDFLTKDFRAKPSYDGVLDMEQATHTKVLQHVMCLM